MLNPTLGEKAACGTTVLGGKNIFFYFCSFQYPPCETQILPSTYILHASYPAQTTTICFFIKQTQNYFSIQWSLREALWPSILICHNTRSLIDQIRAFRGQPLGDSPDLNVWMIINRIFKRIPRLSHYTDLEMSQCSKEPSGSFSCSPFYSQLPETLWAQVNKERAERSQWQSMLLLSSEHWLSLKDGR